MTEKHTEVREDSFPTDLSFDHELRSLYLTELSVLKVHLDKLPTVLKAAYLSLGGNFDRLKRIFSLFVRKVITRKLEKTDLPGPDSLYKSELINALVRFAEEWFDDFFSE